MNGARACNNARSSLKAWGRVWHCVEVPGVLIWRGAAQCSTVGIALALRCVVLRLDVCLRVQLDGVEWDEMT